ncbi:hypothetical protein BB560_001966 [Smittium megazygosporum]|uniref:beta-glucosidase n=1 Tax=Smittium megazygosporum TaxID=133381 RepID=A0A2T9ZG42_9FUNG|nr:hypothetical protein BB560_001966 [Smittium megazygosporum]
MTTDYVGALSVPNVQPPSIPATGPKTEGGKVCLPDNFILQDFDPMRPKSVPTYDLPKFEESNYVGPTDEIDQDVKDLLASLTLEQKVGQMAQYPHSFFIGCDGLTNITAIEHYVDTYGMGSVLTLAAGIFSRWAFWSPQRYANFTNTIQQIAISRGPKIPIIYGIDSVRGAALVKGAVIMPSGYNVAATFDPTHAYTAGKITAKDTRAAGAHWAFGPLADLNSEKKWARNFENFGEDPYLNGEMVYHSIKGYQGDYKKDRTRIAACVKHFIGYGYPHNGHDQEPRYIPMNRLMEYFAPPFQRAFDAGSATVMETYGSLNGEDMVASKLFLRELLRDTMGYKGMMVTDFDEINSQYVKHHTAFNSTDATLISMNSTSVDMSMVGFNGLFAPEVIQLVKAGKIPVSRIEESAGRILQLKKDLGLFENPFSDPALIDTVGSDQDVEAARNTVRDSIVLLKNENDVLPFKPEEKILFVGENINSTRYISGGWEVTALGPTDLEGDLVYDGYGDTVLLGVQKVTGKPVNWIQGYNITGYAVDDFNEVVRLARLADKVVFGFGDTTLTEIPGDIDTLDLNKEQYNLIERVAVETSTPITLLLLQNRPFSLGKLSKYASAIVNGMLPGPYGGLPVAEVLYGKYSPAGRMPYTYPKRDYQSFVTYYTTIWNEYDPEFAFGVGMGYNNITYSNITLSSTELRPGKPVSVSITATNNGKLPQSEPAIMYTTQKIRRRYSPERLRVRSFDKKVIAPGASVEFNFTLTAEEMMFWNVELEKELEEGPVDITINAGNANARVASLYLYEN